MGVRGHQRGSQDAIDDGRQCELAAQESRNQPYEPLGAFSQMQPRTQRRGKISAPHKAFEQDRVELPRQLSSDMGFGRQAGNQLQ